MSLYQNSKLGKVIDKLINIIIYFDILINFLSCQYFKLYRVYIYDSYNDVMSSKLYYRMNKILKTIRQIIPL